MNSSSTRPNRTGAALVEPLQRADLDAVKDIVDMAEQVGGYIPTSFKIMGRKPAILRAFAGLRDAVMRAPGEVPLALKWLAAHAVSATAGCLYCQAHTAANGAKAGIAVDKIESLAQYETASIYSSEERAVIALGLAAGQVPNQTSDAHFEALREHFSEEGIVELIAVLSLFGWLNRWNDTFASDLEAKPLAFAESHLTARGWNAGKHGPS